MILSVFAELHAGHCGHAIFIQQELCKGKAVHAKLTDVREQVERCLGPGAGNAQLFQSVIQQQPAPVKLRQHGIERILGTGQCLQSAQLAKGAGVHGHRLMGTDNDAH